MLNNLIMIVISVANNINPNDFEEFGEDTFTFLNLPQNPSYLDDVIKKAKKWGLKVVNRRNSKSYIKISADKDTWVRFNLITEDDTYGKKGDVNSLDMTRNVYDGVIAPYYETLDIEN